MTQANLEALLSSLDVALNAFAVCEVESGWALRCEPSDDILVHYVLSGEGVVESQGNTASISPGTVIIIPRNTAKSLVAAGPRVQEVEARQCCTEWIDGMVKFRAVETKPELILACASVRATVNGGIGLFDHLQHPLVEAPDNGESLASLFKVLLDELSHPGLGTRLVAQSMMKQSLIFLLRSHLRRTGLASPLFMPLIDPRLRGCILNVIEQPEAAHSVNSLAKLAGMSQSRFATRFVQSYGRSPMEFVQVVRLRSAAKLLQTGDLPLKAIAAAVGYSSRSHLSRVFRRHYGVDPTSYRAQLRQPDRETRSQTSASTQGGGGLRKAVRPPPPS